MGMASISNTMVHCASTSVAYTLMMIKISISLRLPIFNLPVMLTQVVMLMSQVVVIKSLLIFKLIGLLITCQVRASTAYVHQSAKFSKGSAEGQRGSSGFSVPYIIAVYAIRCCTH
jgi:hypothetical protein